MNGTFLNFFECKLSNNVAEIYAIDYKNKEDFERVKEKYPDIYISIDLKEIKSIIGRKIKKVSFLLNLKEYVYIYL